MKTDTLTPLTEQHAKPAGKSDSALTTKQIGAYQKQLEGWQVRENKYLRRRFEFSNFQTALDFVVRASEIVEAEDHHPQITFGWGFAEFEFWTHDVGGLSANDFILAAKINRLAGR